VPKSRVRRKPVYTPPPTRSPKKRTSPPWVGAAMLGCFVLGIIWLVLYYVSGGDVPIIRSLSSWNLFVGFGLIVAGFGLATQWR
jgi:hypothetical protein